MIEQIQFNAGSLILLLTIFQGSIYSLFLLTRQQPNPLPSRLLGTFTAVLSLHFCNVLLVEFGPLPASPNFNPVFGFCYGPLLLLFVRSLVQPRFELRVAQPQLAAPAIVLPLVWLSSRYWPPGLTLISLALLAHLLGYVWLARRELAQFKTDLTAQYSAIDRVNLDWLSTLLNRMLFIALISALHFAIQLAGFAQLQSALTLLIFLSVLYFINALVLKGMSHPSLAVWLDERQAGPEHGGEAASAEDDQRRYLGSSLSEADSAHQFARLQAHMDEHHPFLDENLTAQQLADGLGISSKHLSQIINQNSGQNFYDYINGFRIDLAARLLCDPAQAQQRISQIMYAVGYSAKSTFNSLFKQRTGMTPSGYRRRKGPKS
ncbi:MAG: helix-turn-helix domain-containing protein [Xanthomonadales bacterium]|nr:helix-turn-helix domain-containing protein [Xanthomonadales bacterium]